MLNLKGLGVSEGIAISKSFIYKKTEIIIEKKNISNTDEEIKRFEKSVDISKKQLDELYEKTKKDIGEDEAEIFSAHKMFLNDPEFISNIKEQINTGINSEFAIKTVRDILIQNFSLIDDEYIKERIVDIQDVSDRMLRNLLGIKDPNLSNISEDCIIIAYDLTPSDTASMNKDKVKGFVTQVGGKTSHTSIIAKTMGIPAVVGIDSIFEKIDDNVEIIVDGDSGDVFVNPDDRTISEYSLILKDFLREKEELKKYINKKTITKDGESFKVFANIANHKDVEFVLENDAEGVGLFRTEFIYMDRNSLPEEDEQFKIYKKVLESMQNKPVIIRTLDIGGDKEVNYLNLPKEMNPFMGYRAIRICLDRKDIFKTQLRALLRASIYGKLEIMFPMISSVEELFEAKKVLEEVKNELKDEQIKFSEDIKVGMMIEVPSAAILSDIFAKHVDFFSIGTNDLIQYFTAVDRTNDKVQSLYDPYNPAIIRILNTIISNAHKNNISVGMCGELASDPSFTRLLCGFGLNEFSVNPASVLKTRKNICESNNSENIKLAKDILNYESSDPIQRLLS